MLAQRRWYYNNRCLLKSELGEGQDLVIVRSFDDFNHPVYEIYQQDGKRIGKLDNRRQWVGRLLAEHEIVEKQDFLTRLEG